MPKTNTPIPASNILDCGRQLVAEKGFVGVGLAEILTTAGVPKGSFYYYFASKEAFGTALIEHYFADYQARLAALAAQTHQTGAERLMSYFARWIETQEGSDRAEHCLIVKLAAEIADLSEAMRDRMLAGTETILRFLTELVASGTGRRVDPQLRAGERSGAVPVSGLARCIAAGQAAPGSQGV